MDDNVTDSGVERVAPHHYVFHATWTLTAAQHRVFTVLADLERYPDWWPAFKTARLVGSDRCDIALRAMLPITLRFTLERDVEDPVTGLLRATTTGDITGFVEWQLEPASNHGTTARFTEDVVLQHASAVKLDRAIRPLLEWNHRHAMKSGAAGLARHLRSLDE